MKTFQLLSSIGILSVLFSSCSIEKRVHQSGYHVEWNHKKSYQKLNSIEDTDLAHVKQETNVSQISVDPSIQTSASKSSDAIEKSETGELVQFAPTSTPTASTNISASKKPLIYRVVANQLFRPKAVDNGDDKPEEKRTLHASGIVSLLLGIASIFVPFLGLAIITGLLAVISGAVCIISVSENRDLYWGKGFGVVGLILGVIALIIGMSIFLYG